MSKEDDEKEINLPHSEYRFDSNAYESAMRKLENAGTSYSSNLDILSRISSVSFENSYVHIDVSPLLTTIQKIIQGAIAEYKNILRDYYKGLATENMNMNLALGISKSPTDINMLKLLGLLNEDEESLSAEELIARGILDKGYSYDEYGDIYSISRDEATETMATVLNRYMLQNGYTIDKKNQIYDANGQVVSYVDLCEKIGERLPDDKKQMFEDAYSITIDDFVRSSIREKQNVEGQSLGEQLLSPFASVVNMVGAGGKAVVGLFENMADFTALVGSSDAKSGYNEFYADTLMWDSWFGTNYSDNVDVDGFSKKVEDSTASFIAKDFTGELFDSMYSTPAGVLLDKSSAVGFEHDGSVSKTVTEAGKTVGKLGMSYLLPGGFLIAGATEGGERAQSLFSDDTKNDFDKVAMASIVSTAAGSLRNYTGSKALQGISTVAPTIPTIAKSWLLNPGANLTVANLTTNTVMNSPYTYIFGASTASGNLEEAAIKAIYGEDNSIELGKAKDTFTNTVLTSVGAGSVFGGIAGRANQNNALAELFRSQNLDISNQTFINTGDYVSIVGRGNGYSGILTADPLANLTFDIRYDVSTEDKYRSINNDPFNLNDNKVVSGDQSTKPNGVIPADQSTRPNGVIPADQSTKPNGVTLGNQPTKPNGVIPADQSTRPNGVILGDQSTKPNGVTLSNQSTKPFGTTQTGNKLTNPSGSTQNPTQQVAPRPNMEGPKALTKSDGLSGYTMFPPTPNNKLNSMVANLTGSVPVTSSRINIQFNEQQDLLEGLQKADSTRLKVENVVIPQVKELLTKNGVLSPEVSEKISDSFSNVRIYDDPKALMRDANYDGKHGTSTQLDILGKNDSGETLMSSSARPITLIKDTIKGVADWTPTIKGSSTEAKRINDVFAQAAATDAIVPNTENNIDLGPVDFEHPQSTSLPSKEEQTYWLPSMEHTGSDYQSAANAVVKLNRAGDDKGYGFTQQFLQAGLEGKAGIQGEGTMSQYVEAINEHLQPSQNGGFNTAFEELEHNLEIAADSENFSNAEREEAVRHIEEMIKNMK